MDEKLKSRLSVQENERIEKWRQLSETFSVIPLVGKAPIETGWTKWCHEKRPFRPEEFIGKNAGIACGPASGIIVLDIDEPQRFRELQEEKGWQTKVTYVVRTGSGKRHFYYKYPNDGLVYGKRSWKEGKTTIFDVLGVGGQVVATYSIHPGTGEPYMGLNLSEVTDAPTWLIDYLREGKEHKADNVAIENVNLPADETGAESIAVDSLPIPDDKKALIKEGVPKGKRSEAIMSVMESMLLAGCAESQIRAVMDQYPIGEKYREAGASREKWFAGRMKKARAYVASIEAQMETQQNKQSSKPSISDLLYDIGTECHLFQNEGMGYARIHQDGVVRIHKLTSPKFKGYLRNAYRAKYNRNPNSSAVQEAVENLQAKAQEEGREEPVSFRIAEHEGHIYIHLGLNDTKSVDIHPSYPGGWQVINDPPVNFIWKKSMRPLPVPVHGGSIEELRPIINCPDDKAWKMIVGWIIGSLKPQGPFPVLIIHGEQGAAKSNLSRICHNLIDPSDAVLRGLPQDIRGLVVSASNAWVLSFDNLSGMRRQFSDAFCRLSTGGALTPRKLYEDDEEFVFQVARPIILNGINNMVKMPDLLNRSILIELPALSSSQRKTEAQITAQFDHVRPRVLGALYTAIAKAIQDHQSINLPAMPRMADFAVWVTAAEEALGWNQGDFIKAYTENQSTGADVAISAYPLAQAIISLMETRTQWEGFAQDLLSDLNDLHSVTDEIKNSKNWPKQANAMSNILTTTATILRENKGIDVQSKRSNKGMKIVIKKISSLVLVPKNDDSDDEYSFEDECIMKVL